MTRLAFGLPVIVILAAVPLSAGAQDFALTNPLVDQSGCVDFSGEYMGCLTLGPPPGDRTTVELSRATDPKAIVDLGSATPTMASQTGSRMTRGSLPHSPTATSIGTTFDNATDVLTANGHLGAP